MGFEPQTIYEIDQQCGYTVYELAELIHIYPASIILIKCCKSQTVMAIFSLVLTCFDVALYCQLHKKCLFSGFATYVEYLGVEAVQPEIHLLDQFIISEIQVRRD